MSDVSIDELYAPPADEAGVTTQQNTDSLVSGGTTLVAEDLRAGLCELPALKGMRLYGALCLTGTVVGLAAGSVGMTVLSVLLAVLFLIVLHPGRLAKRQLAKMQPDDRRLTWVFDERAMRVTSAGSDLRLDYERLRRFQETSTTFLLFVEAHQAQIVPKRAFDVGDVDTIRQFLTSANVNHVQRVKATRRLLLWVVVVMLLLAVWLLLA